MKRILLAVAVMCFFPRYATAQNKEMQFIADTLVVQADGTYAADPDLATLTFDITSQEKELKRAYDTAKNSMQRIVALAERTGLKKEDVAMGALSVTPRYEGDRKNKVRWFLVRGQIDLKVRDFSQIGVLLDGAVQDGIADFRSLVYSLQDEEVAKERAVAQAMQRAVGRASAALAQHGQKLGAIRYANLDVTEPVGVAELQSLQLQGIRPGLTVPGASVDRLTPTAPSLPTIHPTKIAVTATIQCAFQVQ